MISSTIHYNTPAMFDAWSSLSFSLSAPLGSGACVIPLDFARCGLASGVTYNLYYVLYNTDGQMLSVNSQAVTFPDGFYAFALPIPDAKAGITCRIFLFDQQFVPQTRTRVLFTEV